MLQASAPLLIESSSLLSSRYPLERPVPSTVCVMNSRVYYRDSDHIRYLHRNTNDISKSFEIQLPAQRSIPEDAPSSHPTTYPHRRTRTCVWSLFFLGIQLSEISYPSVPSSLLSIVISSHSTPFKALTYNGWILLCFSTKLRLFSGILSTNACGGPMGTP